MYNGAHSVYFGDKNTWTDWFLIPGSRPVFNPPKPKTHYLDIPGADGSIDLSESLTRCPVFNDREGTMDFIVDNGHKEWNELYSEIMDYLHGRTMKARLADDPEYYYEGRFSVNEWRSEESNSVISIDYRVSPYKWKTGETLLISHSQSDEAEIFPVEDYEAGTAPTIPRIEISNSDNGITVTFFNSTLDINETVTLQNGSYRLSNFVICPNRNENEMYFAFTGSGTYKVYIRKGGL